MQIEKMTAVLRHRNNWEAVDLGFYMANFWFLRLWFLWILTALPVFITAQLFFYKYPYLVGLLVWWLKPIYELPLLYFLSRALFGEYIHTKTIRENYFQIIKPMFFPLLFWRRFSLSRSFNNPVQMLEELRGNKRRERLNVLNFNTNNVGQWLTVVCVHFEMFLYFSAIGLLFILIPEDVQWFDWEMFFSEESVFMELINNLIYFLGISLIAPFYTAAGFSLYLARRTDLEGWDIELDFKKLNGRIHSSKKLSPIITILLLLCFSGLPSQPVYSQTTDIEKSASIIKEVISRDEFGEPKTRHTWTLRELKNEDVDGWELPGFIEDFLSAVGKMFSWIGNLFSSGAGLLEALLWISVTTLLIFLLLRLGIWSRWLARPDPGQRKKKNSPARLFGLDVIADALPDDILTQVQILLTRGELRVALSLLYRASLIKLIHLHQLDIPESATEGECLQIVKKNRPDNEASFFHRLTRTWLRLAYAHELPDKQDLQDLGQEWQEFYGVKSES